MRLSRLVPTVLLILLATGFTSNAEVYTWNNTGTEWTTATNWTPNGVPTSADIALFNPNGSLFGTPVVNPSLNLSASAFSVTFALNQNFGGWTVTGNGNALTVGGALSTGITTYGPQTTVLMDVALSGSSSGTGLLSFNVTTSSTLTLAGSTSITANQASVLTIAGGKLSIDNALANVSDRLSSTGAISVNGGGIFEFIGNSAGTSMTVGGLRAADNSLGGNNTIRVVANGALAKLTFLAPTGQTGANLNSLRAGTRSTWDFVAASGNLGDATGSQVTFTTAPLLGTGGLFSNTAGGATVGFVTVTDAFGKNFGTYNTAGASAIGVVSIANGGQTVATITTAVDSVSTLTSTTTNYQLNITGGNTLTAAATVNANTLRVSISGGVGATLALGTFALPTPALMLDGANDLAITGSGTVGTGTHYFYVNNPATSLTIANPITSGTFASVFAGPGFVILNGAGLQNNGNSGNNYRLSITGGVLRGSNTQLEFGTVAPATRGVINLYGGVLEIAAGGNGVGASADFRRPLGTTAGSVNWGAGNPDAGSGGFSAFGAPASVSIGGASANLVWNQANFVGDGYALYFGSTKSNAVLTFQNPIQLDNGTTIPYQPREIRVTAGTGGDKTVLSGAITGAALADLVKTGTGVLELTAANTYSGNTLVTAGTLSGPGSITPAVAGGSVRIASGATLNPGTYAATTAPGALTVAEPVTFASGSNFGVRITDATIPGVTANSGLSSGPLFATGANNGFLNVTGTGNALTIPTGTNIVIDGTGTTFTTGTLYSYSIAQANSAPELALGSSFTFTPIGFNATGYSLTMNGNVVNLNFTAAAIPEPSTMLGLGVASLGLIRAIRRRRTAK